MRACDNNYCESINRILNSQAEVTECADKIFCCDILSWLENIEDEEKRICLYNEVMNAYSVRMEALANLICASEKLLEKCSTKNKVCAKKICPGIYILEKVMFISRSCGKSRVQFLIYNKKTKCVVLVNYAKEYDCESIPTNYYFMD